MASSMLSTSGLPKKLFKEAFNVVFEVEYFAVDCFDFSL